MAKLLLCLFFFIIYLTNTLTFAQPPDFISYFCENASNYTTNSTYRRNLDTTLSLLPTTNSGRGFFNLSTGQGNDTVNSVALCRGDINPDACRSCLNDSIVKLRELCPNQREAIGYYDNCLMKYSNETILGNTRIKFYVYLANPQNSTDVNQFNEDLRPLMDGLRRDAASGGPLRKFDSGNTDGPGFSTIYALVQCTPDLSEQQCSDCLEDSINRIPDWMNGRVGGRILKPMCNFRYENYRFFNESTSVVPPPPASPPLPPVFRPSPPPPSGKNSNTTRIVIIVVVIIVVIVIMIIAFIWTFTRMQKKKQQVVHPAENTETETMEISTAESLQYNFNMVKAATNNFSEDNKLG